MLHMPMLEPLPSIPLTDAERAGSVLCVECCHYFPHGSGSSSRIPGCPQHECRAPSVSPRYSLDYVTGSKSVNPVSCHDLNRFGKCPYYRPLVKPSCEPSAAVPRAEQSAPVLSGYDYDLEV